MEENYYKTLEVEREASDKDIKMAYRRLAMRWHPDKNPDKKHEAESKFKKISEAYNILGDTLKRVSYDYHHMEPSDYYYGCGTTKDTHTDFTYKYDKTSQRTQGEKPEWMWCIWVTIIGIFVVPLMLLFSFIFVLDSIASWLYETFQ